MVFGRFSHAEAEEGFYRIFSQAFSDVYSLLLQNGELIYIFWLLRLLTPLLSIVATPSAFFALFLLRFAFLFASFSSFRLQRVSSRGIRAIAFPLCHFFD